MFSNTPGIEEGTLKYQNFTNEVTPTQTHGLTTTVPQSMAKWKLGDKHTPTKNSLRHSRMMNTKIKVPTEQLPPIVKNHLRAKIFMWIILITGIVLCFECSSIQIYAPNSRPQLNPFYTAIPILLSGIFGFVHLSCCRKEYPGLRKNFCEKSIKVSSIVTSVIATLSSSVYIYNISLHILSFLILKCSPPDLLVETCNCQVTNMEMATSMFNNSWHYVDLSCFEVYYIFNVILAFTAITCLVLMFLNVFYLKLHWASRLSSQFVKQYDFI